MRIIKIINDASLNHTRCLMDDASEYIRNNDGEWELYKMGLVALQKEFDEYYEKTNNSK